MYPLASYPHTPHIEQSAPDQSSPVDARTALTVGEVEQQINTLFDNHEALATNELAGQEHTSHHLDLARQQEFVSAGYRRKELEPIRRLGHIGMQVTHERGPDGYSRYTITDERGPGRETRSLSWRQGETLDRSTDLAVRKLGGLLTQAQVYDPRKYQLETIEVYRQSNGQTDSLRYPRLDAQHGMKGTLARARRAIGRLSPSREPQLSRRYSRDK